MYVYFAFHANDEAIEIQECVQKMLLKYVENLVNFSKATETGSSLEDMMLESIEVATKCVKDGGHQSIDNMPLSAWGDWIALMASFSQGLASAATNSFTADSQGVRIMINTMVSPTMIKLAAFKTNVLLMYTASQLRSHPAMLALVQADGQLPDDFFLPDIQEDFDRMFAEDVRTKLANLATPITTSKAPQFNTWPNSF
jgi:hypothetical protein